MKKPITKAQRIINEWNTLIPSHPSYGAIAIKVGCQKSYAFKIIKQYQEQQKKGKR